MKTTNNNRKSKFLAFLLSVMMVSSAGAIFASCAEDGEDSSSSSSSSSETTEEAKTDDGLIKNANFDFTELSSKTAIGTSVTGWSRSVNSTSSGSASSSKSASGVIDTSADSWKYLTGSNYTEDQLKAMSDADAEKDWDKFSVKDKLAYYDIWKDREANKDKSISTDFKAYEAINIDEEDVPTIANPGTRPAADGEELDSQVLMLHNHYYTTGAKEKPIGTAQKYTSSSTVTIPAGSSAKFSVWVKTADLQSASSGNSATQDAVGKGAYISVTHSVGGKSLDAYEVKNINTDDWKQYTFYIKGSYYADTTFSLVLGLGQGSTNDRLEYVNGYAFFDDIQCEIIDNGDFDTETTGLKTADLDDEKIDKTVDAYANAATAFAMNFYGKTWTDETTPAVTAATATKESDGSSVNPAAASTDVTKTFANQAAIETEAANNEYLQIVYDHFFKDTDFVANNEILMFLSTNGTAYTAEKAAKFTLPANTDYMAVSFFVKTSDLNGGTGAGVTLVDELNKTSFTSIDTSALKGVKIGDDEDAYDGWQQVFFFVERDEEVDDSEALDFYLTFNYGPTDITSSTAKTGFAQGFAAFTKFSTFTNMTELEYETAATGTYAKKVTLKGEQEDKATGNGGFDSAEGVPSNALEEGLANPQNYKGVYNDSYRVSLPLPTDTTADKEAKRAYNTYENAGLLNRENFIEYFNTNTDAWLTALKTAAGSTKAEDVWNYHFADATQPLVIMNDATATKSYGFIGTSKSTSDEYTAVSLRVKTTGNATASVYLVDMDDTTRQSMLSVSRTLTYWYDDEGNVCTGDPSKNSSAVAFKLQKNGLYKASKTWEGYEKLGSVKDEYFANLSAYTEIDGILYAAENSAIHDYYDYKWNREMFYKHTDGSYYTEANGAGVKVVDLKSVTKLTDSSNQPLTARYLPEEKQELMLEGIATQDKWVTVTFYIRKGASAKNYRLEVWSGTRDGKTVNTDGYVAFDTNNPGTAADNFALADEYKEVEGVKWFEGVFSYFDTDKHVRYNAELDTDKSGNVYEESYTPSTFTESVAYLAYLNENGEDGYNVFADFSVSDQTVVAKEVSDDTTEEDSSEEEETENDGSVWLLASSISVAVVLVLAVASIAVRKIVENFKKKHGTKVRKAKEKKAPVAKKAEKEVDEDSPYND